MVSWKSVIVGVILFVAITAGAFAAMQIADSSQDSAATGDAQTVTNETLVQYTGVYQLVSKSTDEYTARFGENVTVYNNSSVELEEGTDYAWNESDGAIKFYDTANTTDGNQTNITYTYYENTQGVRDIAGPLNVVVFGLTLTPIMAAGLGFLVLFLGFAVIILRQMDNIQTRR